MKKPTLRQKFEALKTKNRVKRKRKKDPSYRMTKKEFVIIRKGGK